MNRAYVYGMEVIILDFHLARLHGTPYVKVRYIDNNWVHNVPLSVIEIR